MGASRCYIVDNDFNILSYNSAMKEFCPEVEIGKKCYECGFGYDHPCPHCSIGKPINGPRTSFDSVRGVGVVVDNLAMVMPDGTDARVIVLSDVSKDVTLPGEFDRLTGLMNRSGFTHFCATFETESLDDQIGTIACDVTNLPSILRKYGDSVAEKVIRHVKRQLESPEATLGYVGGGRFVGVVKLWKRGDIESLSDLCKRIESTSPLPDIGIKVGGFRGTRHDGSVHALVGYAEVALNSILGSASRSWIEFDFETYKDQIEDQRITNEAIQALRNGEFQIYLQPKCEIETGALVGSEALVRWVKPDGSIIPPNKFIPQLERHQLISELDKYVWEKTFLIIRNWLDYGINALPVSVNVSRLDASILDVAGVLKGFSEKYDVPTRLVEVEITETAYVENGPHVREMESQLKECGFHILIDDFGSGQSSLAMLKDIKADILKLDMGFLSFDPNDKTRAVDIVESVLKMAHQIDMYVIVEGVETKDQVDLLKLLGCQYAQGYYFHKPMPVREFSSLLLGSTSMMIPEGYHGSGKSSVQRLAECFWRIAEVNLETGAYRFIRNGFEPDNVSSPRARDVQEYMQRYVNQGYIHPDDVEIYLHDSGIDTVRESFENGSMRHRAMYRYSFGGKWKWCVFEAVRTQDYSKESPWALFAWSGAANDVSWHQDAERLFVNNHKLIMVFNCKTLECHKVNGGLALFDEIPKDLSNIQNVLREYVGRGAIHPDDADSLLMSMNFEEMYKHFQQSDEPMSVTYRYKRGDAWAQGIAMVSRSVDFTPEEPLLIGRVRNAVAALPGVGETNLRQSKDAIEKLGLAETVYLTDKGDDIVFDAVSLLESIPGGFFVYEGYGDEEILYANGELLRIFGCENTQEFVELTGATFKGIVHPDDYGHIQHVIETQIKDDFDNDDQLLDYVSYRITRKDGTVIWVQDYGRQIEHGAHGMLYSVFVSTVPDARMEAYRIAHRMGITDMLCDMLNRNSFETRKHAVIVEGTTTCAYFDLNGLHEINNEFGHDEGDSALICVAQAIKDEFDVNDCFRIGGDEFAVLTHNLDEQDAIRRVSSVIEKTEAAGYSVSSGMKHVVGECDVNAIVREAETAMRSAKREYYIQGRDRRDSWV